MQGHKMQAWLGKYSITKETSEVLETKRKYMLPDSTL